MKAIYPVLLITLSLLMGCGKVANYGAVGGAGGLGQSRSFVAAPASTAQLNQVLSLCSRLEQKQTNYQTFVNGVSRFNFDTSYKPCEGATQTSSVVALLNNNGGVLTYTVQSGQYLATRVETNTSGLISQLCAPGNALGYPQATSSTVPPVGTREDQRCTQAEGGSVPWPPGALTWHAAALLFIADDDQLTTGFGYFFLKPAQKQLQSWSAMFIMNSGWRYSVNTPARTAIAAA